MCMLYTHTYINTYWMYTFIKYVYITYITMYIFIFISNETIRFTNLHPNNEKHFQKWLRTLKHLKPPLLTIFKVVLLEVPNHSWLFFHFCFVFLILENEAHFGFHSWARRKKYPEGERIQNIFFSLFLYNLWVFFHIAHTAQHRHANLGDKNSNGLPGAKWISW